MESNLRGLEIKDQMVGVECLDLNTSVGGSFSENGHGKCDFFLVGASESRWCGWVIHSDHQISNHYTPLCTTRWNWVKNLEGPTSAKDSNVIHFGETR